MKAKVSKGHELTLPALGGDRHTWTPVVTGYDSLMHGERSQSLPWSLIFQTLSKYSFVQNRTPDIAPC
jgi:hypothetical protein